MPNASAAAAPATVPAPAAETARRVLLAALALSLASLCLSYSRGTSLVYMAGTRGPDVSVGPAYVAADAGQQIGFALWPWALPVVAALAFACYTRAGGERGLWARHGYWVAPVALLLATPGLQYLVSGVAVLLAVAAAVLHRRAARRA